MRIQSNHPTAINPTLCLFLTITTSPTSLIDFKENTKPLNDFKGYPAKETKTHSK